MPKNICQSVALTPKRQAREDPGQRECDRETYRQAGCGDDYPTPHYHAQHVYSFGAQRHADADLARVRS